MAKAPLVGRWRRIGCAGASVIRDTGRGVGNVANGGGRPSRLQAQAPIAYSDPRTKPTTTTTSITTM